MLLFTPKAEVPTPGMPPIRRPGACRPPALVRALIRSPRVCARRRLVDRLTAAVSRHRSGRPAPGPAIRPRTRERAAGDRQGVSVPASDLDTDLAAERAHLASSRAALNRMRQRAE